MESKSFRVEVTGKERSIYLVEAPDTDAAKRIAADRWRRGDPGDVAGFDWLDQDSITVSLASEPSGQDQDDELVLRFVRERENLLLRMGDPLLSTTGNDAISAAQAAVDLGLFRPDGEPDSVRAAEALERLCARKELVSFRRNRVRANERGDILLYCTPGYLEELASELNEDSDAPAIG